MIGTSEMRCRRRGRRSMGKIHVSIYLSRVLTCRLCRDFGGIFAELLPGNFAKLQPPEGQDLMQGLEVKVQLGSVWKQSLTELSGGQRQVAVHPVSKIKDSKALSVQVTYSALTHHGPPPIQTCPDVYPRRNRCRPRPLAHATHRPALPYAFQGLPIHRCLT